jgi:hypothetical protein
VVWEEGWRGPLLLPNDHVVPSLSMYTTTAFPFFFVDRAVANSSPRAGVALADLMCAAKPPEIHQCCGMEPFILLLS